MIHTGKQCMWEWWMKVPLYIWIFMNNIARNTLNFIWNFSKRNAIFKLQGSEYLIIHTSYQIWMAVFLSSTNTRAV
jgi:hypothetical protein